MEDNNRFLCLHSQSSFNRDPQITISPSLSGMNRAEPYNIVRELIEAWQGYLCEALTKVLGQPTWIQFSFYFSVLPQWLTAPGRLVFEACNRNSSIQTL